MLAEVIMAALMVLSLCSAASGTVELPLGSFVVPPDAGAPHPPPAPPPPVSTFRFAQIYSDR